MARKKKKALPTAGAAFAFPLEDGRFSACRVLVDASSKRSKRWGANAFLVAGSAWIGNRVPRADEPALRPILRLTHHAHKNTPNVLWISDEPPPELIPIGTIELTPEERRMPCQTLGGWGTILYQPLAQWKWDNEREAVVAEDVIQRKKAAKAGLKAQREREQDLKKVTLDDLRGRRFFANWKDFPSPKAVRASRKIMSKTVEELLELGPRASKKARMAILQQCIESFNDLNDDMHFIETTAREDICDEFEVIVYACGLGAHENLADEWRDW